MNRVDLLLRTPAVSLTSFDHPPSISHSDPEYEVAERDSINFVEGGSFHVQLDQARWQIGEGTLFVASRGMSFSCTHDCETPTDRCLSVTYAEQAVEDLMHADVPALRPPVVELSATHNYLRHRLRSCGSGQEMRFELLAGALFESLATSSGSARAFGDVRVTQLVRRIDRAVDLIEAEFARALTLQEIAQAAGMSAFHFARVFRSLVGVPPHRYLTAVRLRQAARLIGQGASVTHTCYEVGFGSLSHFVTAFKNRFGINPSDAKAGARCATLRSALRAPSWVSQGH